MIYQIPEAFVGYFILTLIVLSFFSFSPVAHADMGVIIPGESFYLAETGQKAIIAHDGFEELLILSTELFSPEPQSIMRIIPFPSQPKVFPVSEDLFQTLEEIATEQDLHYLFFAKSPTPQKEKLTITFQATIGAHQVTTLRVENETALLSWLENFLTENELPSQIANQEELKTVVKDYISRGISYFVFDLVPLERTQERVEPLGYLFPSRHFYYPVKISSLFSDTQGLELFVFSNQGETFPLLQSIWPGWSGGGMSNTILLEEKDLTRIHPEIASLMGKRALMTAFRHSHFSDFSEDIDFPVPVWEINSQSFAQPHFQLNQPRQGD
ncbi:MAG: hypothetical protein PWP04_1840 [Candidatus Atribacteria bacterium]|nr:hypothetical protein [Candidatus Atribacteria bacterium]